MNFRINDGTSNDEDFTVFDEGVEDQEVIAKEYEVADIEGKINRRRQMAIDYGRARKRYGNKIVRKTRMINTSL